MKGFIRKNIHVCTSSPFAQAAIAGIRCSTSTSTSTSTNTCISSGNCCSNLVISSNRVGISNRAGFLIYPNSYFNPIPGNSFLFSEEIKSS